MRIIVPYGKSVTAATNLPCGGAIERQIQLRGSDKNCAIEQFVQQHPALLIAQWISVIDKILLKPSPHKTTGQHEQSDSEQELIKARQRLGEACLQFIPGAKQWKPEQLATWNAKINAAQANTKKHYGNAKENKPRPSKFQGRWYKSFGLTASTPAEIDRNCAIALAEKIYNHLHTHALRRNGDIDDQRQGHIAHRASSIHKNVLHYDGVTGNKICTVADKYFSEADIAETIYKKIFPNQSSALPVGERKLAQHIIVAQLLHEHYRRVFGAVTIQEARSTKPELFSLHMVIRATYQHLLKHSRRVMRSKMHDTNRDKKTKRCLPKNRKELEVLIKQQAKNRDSNALIRLGRIIHYSAKAFIATDFPTKHEIEHSLYWTSAGQTFIKQTEAFIRVWRHVLALAARSLNSWAGPNKTKNSDILLENTLQYIDPEHDKRYRQLLYGESAIAKAVEGASILQYAHQSLAALRHASFHFKHFNNFIAKLREDPSTTQKVQAPASIEQLIIDDSNARFQRLQAIGEAAGMLNYYSEDNLRQLMQAISQVTEIDAALPLPRLSRLLKRYQNTCSKAQCAELPAIPEDRLQLTWQCQYTTLGWVYSRAFRPWLAKQSSERLNEWIKRAYQRSTADAEKINASADKSRVIMARAERLGGVSAGESLHDYFYRLTAATASEMQVQKGYDSNSEQAATQAEYIQNALMDVVALAFIAYLSEKHFTWIIKTPQTRKHPATWPQDIVYPSLNWETWQARLYFLLHLVPVDEASKLLHQLRKWQIVTQKTTAANTVNLANQGIAMALPLVAVFDLYLDMHDAKYTEALDLDHFKFFERCYNKTTQFDALFRAPQSGKNSNTALSKPLIARRGLREILRFGNEAKVRAMWQYVQVSDADYQNWQAQELEVAEWQHRRRCLHDEWAKKPRYQKTRFIQQHKEEYSELVKKIAAHRHLTAKVLLTNPLRLYRLTMAVLARLLDYSGLWERDLYFITLAQLYITGKKPKEIWKLKDECYLKNGQIVVALRKIDTTAAGADDVRKSVYQQVFAQDQENKCIVDIRNDFAHFNMLQADPKLPPSALNLTLLIDKARRLMAYDRKLKNAVTKSIKDLLAREGLELEWLMDVTHTLRLTHITSRQALHWGGNIKEDLHGQDYVEAVRRLFDGNDTVGI